MEQQLDVKEVREFLYEVRKKWYDIGIELDVPIEQLDIIKCQENEQGQGVCLRELLKVRLRFIEPVTWKVVGDALKASAVNETELGEKGTIDVCQKTYSDSY